MATLLIETPAGEQIEVEIHDPRLDTLPLSDSRAQMPDLKKIAAALGLAEDASEDAILTKLAERPSLDAAKVAEALGVEDADEAAIVAKAKELADGGEASVEDRARAEGKVVVKVTDFEQLTADAAKGAQAADELRQMAFDSAYKAALDGGRIDGKDETKQRFQKLYDADSEATLETLANLPKVVNMTAAGSGEGKGETPENVDADRHDLDVAARSRAADKDIPYERALSQVLAERSAA